MKRGHGQGGGGESDKMEESMGQSHVRVLCDGAGGRRGNRILSTFTGFINGILLCCLLK